MANSLCSQLASKPGVGSNGAEGSARTHVRAPARACPRAGRPLPGSAIGRRRPFRRQAREGAGRFPAVCASLPDVGQPGGVGSLNVAQGKPLASHDVVALNNLCVDVVLPVDSLPSPDLHERQRLLKKLTLSPTSQDSWEVGGSTNFLISAARLGMDSASIGHLHSDPYGTFLESVLLDEEVRTVQKVVTADAWQTCSGKNESMDEDEGLDNTTLVCFVLVDPDGKHCFCSRYDFGPWPLVPVQHLPEAAMQLLRTTKVLYLNGYTFDELRPATVMEAVMEAEANGAAVFFDPGPRALTLLEGQRREAMDAVLDHTTTMLVTLEEGQAITGCDDAVSIAEAFLKRPGSTRMEWVVVKNGGEGATLVTRDMQVFTSPGFKVEVEDTVGCGDSFAAAIVLGYIRRADTDISTTLKLANAVGAATATRTGAGRNVGYPSTVNELLSGAEGCEKAMQLLVSSKERNWAASEI